MSWHRARVLSWGAETKEVTTSRADFAAGEKLFGHHCALCHGPKGGGGCGPLLAQAKLRQAPDDAALIKTITEGIRATEMPGAENEMSEHEIRHIAAYVRSLGRVPQKLHRFVYSFTFYIDK